MTWARKRWTFWSAFVLVSVFGIALTHGAVASRPSDVSVLLTSMNEARITSHLHPLRLDPRLSRIAYAHAVDMERRNYFAHTSPEGETPFARMASAHYPFGYAGENLAVDCNARTIFTDFWHSSEHRSNMLGAHYVHVGIASVSAPVGTIVVEDFSD